MKTLFEGEVLQSMDLHFHNNELGNPKISGFMFGGMEKVKEYLEKFPADTQGNIGEDKYLLTLVVTAPFIMAMSAPPTEEGQTSYARYEIGTKGIALLGNANETNAFDGDIEGEDSYSGNTEYDREGNPRGDAEERRQTAAEETAVKLKNQLEELQGKYEAVEQKQRAGAEDKDNELKALREELNKSNQRNLELQRSQDDLNRQLEAATNPENDKPSDANKRR